MLPFLTALFTIVPSSSLYSMIFSKFFILALFEWRAVGPYLITSTMGPEAFSLLCLDRYFTQIAEQRFRLFPYRRWQQ